MVDYPNSRKAKKYYLVIWSGGAMSRPSGMEEYGQVDEAGDEQQQQALPRGLTAEHEVDEGDAAAQQGTVKFQGRRQREARESVSKRKKKTKKDQLGLEKGTKEWVKRKKDLYRKRGKEDVPTDSKFSGRKRRPQF